jgi:membrane-bound metal-dependent hydrolase YbcI (DUF457 family)
MVQAVAHMLIPMIVVDLIRDHVLKVKKHYLSNKYVLVAGVAGLLPDIDIVISILFFHDLSIHRTFTHSIWVPIGLLIATLIFYKMKKMSYFKFTLMALVGVSFHIFLDYVFTGWISLFIPLNSTLYGLNILPVSQAYLLYSSIDAVLLFFWLIHEELTHKLSDFI